MNFWNLKPKDFCCNLIRPNKLDVIIFGASGYMGQRAVQEAITVLKNVTWGIAGRDRYKLQEVLLDVGQRFETDLCDRPIYIANVLDRRSIINMAERCRVLVNCCGPYEIYGETVVSACIEAGTNYVDLSVGPYFAELMQLQFHCEAKHRNVYIVPGCGFHSLPYDLAVMYLQKHFNGLINSVETYTNLWIENGRVELPLAHGGLWTGIVLAASNMPNVKGIRHRLQRRELPTLTPKIEYKPPHESEAIAPGVFFPFPMHDQVERTQYYFFERERKRPIQYFNYTSLPTILMAFVFMIWCFIIGMLSQIKSMRVLLIQLPRLFTLGVFSTDGPDECQAQRLHFCIRMKATGWSARKQCDQNDNPNKTMTVTLTGNNPLYGVGCVCLLASALTLLDEEAHRPDSGGVYSPGVAFGQTQLLNELQQYEHGLLILLDI